MLRAASIRRFIGFTLVCLLLLYAIWPWLYGSSLSQRRTVIVYGFSILGEVMNDGIFPAFKKSWHEKTGEEIEFIAAFAGSGTVVNQIRLGVPVQVAILSHELDALRLVEYGVVTEPIWNSLPNHGILNRTPFIIMVRPGNPAGIHDFADLTKAGIKIVHPDPLISGGALWAILAEYGSALQTGSSAKEAYKQLLGIWKNVSSQAPSARAARTQFDNGFGDALITYEQEALWDKAHDRLKSDLVYPQSTILSEHIVVRVDRNIKPKERALISAFTDFLWTNEAQQIFVRFGFRSIKPELDKSGENFGEIKAPFVVADLGGWTKAKADIIEDQWKKKVLPALQRP